MRINLNIRIEYMKRIAFTIITILTSYNLMAQTHNVALQGGINISNIRAEMFFDDTDNHLGFIGGLKYELFLLDRYSIGSDILYSQQGFTDRVTWRDDQFNRIGQDADTKFNYDYLSIPIKFGYIIGRKFNFIPKIGLQPSILLSAKTIIPISDNNGDIIDEEIRDVKEYVAPFDLAGIIELDIGYNLTHKISISTLLSGMYSLTTFSDTEYFSCCDLKHYALGISLGLKYKIIKN